MPIANNRAREKYRFDPEYRAKKLAAAKAYYRKHKDRCLIYKRKYALKIRYRLTAHQRQELIIQQRSRCAICNEKVFLVVDHCHKLNKVRAMLCQPCNKMIGFAREDCNILTSAIRYLERWVNDNTKN